MEHVDDGYSRSLNFGGSLVHNTFLTYSQHGTNVYGSRGEEIEGI